MKIEGNQKELDAMVEFHKGNRVEGLRLQEEFAAEFRKEYKDKDHCPCLKACRYHGNCKECVAIHRAHQEHVRQVKFQFDGESKNHSCPLSYSFCIFSGSLSGNMAFIASSLPSFIAVS